MKDARLKTRAEVVETARKNKAEKVARQRQRGVKKRNPKTGGHRFPENVNEPLRQFVRGLPCALHGALDGYGLPHVCVGTIAACHLKTRGSGAPDDDNLWPGCWGAHYMQEGNTRAFIARWGLNLKAVCRKVTARFLRETGRTL